MKVIVDNKIPYIQGIIEQLADEVIYLPGKAFTPPVPVHSATANCWKEAVSNSSVPLPSGSIISIQSIVKRQVSPGAIARGAMPELWNNTFTPFYNYSNAKKESIYSIHAWVS